MPFEGGYDDRWVLQDIIKDRSYDMLTMGVGLASIRDANLRRLVQRMHSDASRHLEQLVTVAHNKRNTMSPQPAAVGWQPRGYRGFDAPDAPSWQMERRTGTTDGEGAERGWNSPIPHGEGSYEGTTGRQRELKPGVLHDAATYAQGSTLASSGESETRGVDASGSRGVPRYRDQGGPRDH